MTPMNSPVVTSLPRRRRRGGAASQGQRLQPTRALARNSGRAWVNGREVGGADPRFAHLTGSYD